MNKKGFVFVETIVVLSLLLVGIISIYTLYNKLSVNIDYKDYYDSVNDLYKTKIIRNLLNIEDTSNVIFFDSSTCSQYFIIPYDDATVCKEIMEELHAKQVLITDYNYDSFSSQYYSTEATQTISFTIPNSMGNYLRDLNLDKSYKALIVNYQYLDLSNSNSLSNIKTPCFYDTSKKCKNYYSSLKFGG